MASELDHYNEWITVHPECALCHMTIQQSLTAYLLNYPNRTIPLLAEVLQDAMNFHVELKAREDQEKPSCN